MQQTLPPLVQIILRYDAPLQRYARFIIKDASITALLVKNVLEQVYDENGFTKPPTELRRQLKNYTLTACRYWLQVNKPQPAQKN